MQWWSYVWCTMRIICKTLKPCFLSFFYCSDIISPYQKRPSKVFPLVLPILTNLWVFFKIPKIQKLYNIRAIFLRVVWTSKRSKWSLKSKKTRFFKSFLRGWKRLGKNVFFEISKTTSIFSMFKLLSKILHGYYTTFVFLEFWKKLINSSKSAKQVGIL